MTGQSAENGALTFASAYVGTDGSVRVHYARCEPCMFGQHDGGPHDWAGPEDIAHAKATDQPDPTGQPCACRCTKEPPRGPEELDFESVDQGVCDLCGEVGACAYDTEGRPLIHAQGGDDD